ncbi:DUF3575 domain-containing protein [Hymenobacter nivis]|uniref:DUF3575 domain-containing protein n=1 Tax=Hymenobacter nivis TaxID=1850093 RepID=UPI00137598AD|nr:DUF3575 domain-containing protein [Hymenobacter nivis]
MKKLLTAAALVLAAGSASAQSNIVKVNVLSPLVHTGSFFYERQLTVASSLELGGLFTSWTVLDTKITGFALTPEYRFYLSANKPALQGFYVGPFLRYQNLTLKNDYEAYDENGNATTQTNEAALNTFGGGVVVGHQWVFKQRFALDAFLGPSYNGGTVKEKDPNGGGSFDTAGFSGFGLRTGIAFGVAF